MARKRKDPILPFDSEDFNWCVYNDFQVYSVKDPNGWYKIAVRRNGITTNGLDSIVIDGVTIESVETVGKMNFKTLSELSAYLPFFYKQLRKKYG